jgi:hypothetical protein
LQFEEVTALLDGMPQAKSGRTNASFLSLNSEATMQNRTTQDSFDGQVGLELQQPVGAHLPSHKLKLCEVIKNHALIPIRVHARAVIPSYCIRPITTYLVPHRYRLDGSGIVILSGLIDTV